MDLFVTVILLQGVIKRSPPAPPRSASGAGRGLRADRSTHSCGMAVEGLRLFGIRLWRMVLLTFCGKTAGRRSLWCFQGTWGGG